MPQTLEQGTEKFYGGDCKRTEVCNKTQIKDCLAEILDKPHNAQNLAEERRW